MSFQDCGPRSSSVQNNEGDEGGQAGVGYSNPFINREDKFSLNKVCEVRWFYTACGRFLAAKLTPVSILFSMFFFI